MTHDDDLTGGTSRYPLDFDELEKGLRIEQPELEQILNVKLDGTDTAATRYRCELMSLCARIETELRDRGTPATVRTQNGALLVLTDDQAAEYNHDDAGRGLRKFFRAQRRLVEVDPSKLTDEQRAQHDRNLLRGGAVSQAIIAARRKKLDFGPTNKRALPRPKGGQ